MLDLAAATPRAAAVRGALLEYYALELIVGHLLDQALGRRDDGRQLKRRLEGTREEHQAFTTLAPRKVAKVNAGEQRDVEVLVDVTALLLVTLLAGA